MSNVTTGLVAYVDQESTNLLVPAIVQGVTASIVTIQPGIKSSAALQKFDTSVTFQDDDCAFNASDTTTYSQRILAVDDIKVQEQLCQKDLEAFWTQKLLTAGSEITEADIPAMYMEQKMNVLQSEIEVALWRSEDGVGAGNLAFTDGYLMKIDGDGAGVCINGNPGAITTGTGIVAGNVIGIFQDQYVLLPEALIEKTDIHSFCGWDTFRTLLVALTNANLFHYVTDGATESGSLTLPGLGMKITAVSGLTGTNRIVTASASNLYMGTDLISDSENMRMWLADDKRNLRSDISFKLGTEIAYLEEVVEFSLV
jgi:hypothetical protein